MKQCDNTAALEATIEAASKPKRGRPKKETSEKEKKVKTPKVKKSNKVKLRDLSGLPYIDGDPSRGVLVDWNLVRKAYKALKCPPQFFDPTLRPIDICKYLLEISRRGTGKTTGVILLGMILNEMYGITTVYIRQNYDMIAEKTVNDMMTTIINCGYIQNITDNRYNYAILERRRWYLCKIDDDGNIIDRCNNHFMFMCDILHAKTLKSGFSDNMADNIIFDEFINDDMYYPNEFVKFCDLLCTLIRVRKSPIIWMLANTIDKESPYFHEMDCYELVKKMKPGDSETYTTERGTKVYVEYFSPEKANPDSNKTLKEMVGLFFGFKNSRLGSITGEDWAVRPVPHIPEGKINFIMRNLYVYSHNRYVSLDIVDHETLGPCCYVHWATKVYDDSIILTDENITDPRYVYGWGDYNRLGRMLRWFSCNNRFYYAHNDVSAFLRAYINTIPETI